MSANDETWLPIPGYEGYYEASDQGHVRSLDRCTYVKPSSRVPTGYWRQFHGTLIAVLPPSETEPYPTAHLRKAGRTRTFRVHVLVARTFLGERPTGLLVRHLNGDALDTRASNLAYGTSTENALDTVAHGHHRQASQTKCGRGHEFTAENTYHNPRGFRECRTCARGWKNKHRQKKDVAA